LNPLSSRFWVGTVVVAVALIAFIIGTSGSGPAFEAPVVMQPSAAPLRLEIPAINVTALVETVGTTTSGALGAPEGPSSVGWWESGVVPGQIGSAVMDGHFGWKNGVPAVFDRLHTLKSGDLIYVEDGQGHTFVFVVRELRLYGQDSPASEVFRSSDGKAHLNLITCEGEWNAVDKSYSNRLVVFADLQ